MSFRQTLIDELLATADPLTGEKVLERVLTREEAFPGARMESAPDLTLVMRDRSFLSVLRADAYLKQRRAPYGTHHPDGIFIANGPHLRNGETLDAFSIINVAPTVLYSLGLPVPTDMEGRGDIGKGSCC